VRAAWLGEGLRDTVAACLSRAVADAARSLPWWREVRVAAARDQTALLDLLAYPGAKPSC
jgi:hypothetical protein